MGEWRAEGEWKGSRELSWGGMNRELRGSEG